MLRSEILVTLLIFVALLSTTLVLSEEGDDKGVEEGSDPPYYVKIDVANFESYGDPHHGSFILKVKRWREVYGNNEAPGNEVRNK